MKIQTRVVGDVVIITPIGMLWEGKETDDLDEAMHVLSAEGNQKLIVDLGEAVVLGNRPLGVMFRVWADYAKRGGRVVFCRVGMREQRIIRMDQFLELYATEDEAVRSFGLNTARGDQA